MSDDFRFPRFFLHFLLVPLGTGPVFQTDGSMGYNRHDYNMKKIMLFLFTFVSVTMGFAQQQVATLNHNDSITPFYGAGALQQAHAVAAPGDIITLSSGTFNAVNITKAVTIRGAGMFADTASNTMATFVVGEFTINLPQDSMRLSIEGIRFSQQLYISLYNAYFSKCKFDGRFIGNSSNYCNNTTFVNCIFLKDLNNIKGSIFINSVISPFNTGLYDFRYNPNNTFNNCIVNAYMSFINDGNIYSNCIMRGQPNNPSSSCFNCLGSGVNSSGQVTGIFFSSPQNNNCKNISSWESVFKTFTGTYYEGETFELQDSIATKYLGTDGTQIGIYGGVMPFDPKVGNPKIRRCNVARRSTADGKLSVDIEVVP